MRSQAAAVLVSLCLLTSPVRLAALSLPDVADGHASNIDGYSLVSSDPTLFVSRFGVHETRAALEFDLGSLPPGAPVTRAVLQPWFVGADLLVGVHGALGDGAITTADFTFSDQIATFDPTAGLGPTLNEIDVTSLIASMTASHFFVFQLRELHEIDGNAIVSGTPFTPVSPRLQITVPAPAALLLLGSGLGVAIALRSAVRGRRISRRWPGSPRRSRGCA